jgi:16S rRNA (guanine966-N2)-methyltransferase
MGYMQSVRIISGSAGSRRLRAPAGAGTRPTADKVRQAIFNILGPPPAEAAVLDLFAGAGGLGLEALSRGAARAVFVDQAPAALRCLRDNVAALEAAAQSEIVAGEGLRALRKLGAAGRRFHWIFVDPPYASDLAARALAEIARHGLLAEGGVAVIEHDRRHPTDAPPGLVQADRRRYGDTEVSFYRRGEP